MKEVINLLSAEEEPKPKKVKLTITLPTKETVIDALAKLFPGIKVEVEEEKPSEETPTEP